MIKKKVVIIFVEVIIVLLFLMAINFFYNLKIANLAVTDYQSQIDRIGGLLSKSLETSKKAKDANDSLMQDKVQLQGVVASLQGENNQLKEKIVVLEKDLDRLQINSNTVTPLKDRVRSIMATLDSLNIPERSKDDIETLLRSIYNELSSIDISAAKLAKTEPLYRAVARDREGQLQMKVEEAQKMLRQNYELTEKMTAAQKEAQELRQQMELLAKEKESVSGTALAKEKELAQYQGQVVVLQKEREAEEDELARQKEELSRLHEAISLLAQEEEGLLGNKDDLERKIALLKSKGEKITGLQGQLESLKVDYAKVSGQYALLRSQISQNESTMARRADRIIVLEDSVKGKATSLTKIKEAMKGKIKELAIVRDTIVKVKLENARLKNSLSQKEKAFADLQSELGNISKIHERFSAASLVAEPDKKVDVEINAIEGQKVK